MKSITQVLLGGGFLLCLLAIGCRKSAELIDLESPPAKFGHTLDKFAGFPCQQVIPRGEQGYPLGFSFKVVKPDGSYFEYKDVKKRFVTDYYMNKNEKIVAVAVYVRNE